MGLSVDCISELRNYILEKSNHQSQNAILSQCRREKSGPPQMERFTSIFLLEEIFVKKCHFRSILPNDHLWTTTQVNSTPFRKSSNISQNFSWKIGLILKILNQTLCVIFYCVKKGKRTASVIVTKLFWIRGIYFSGIHADFCPFWHFCFPFFSDPLFGLWCVFFFVCNSVL